MNVGPLFARLLARGVYVEDAAAPLLERVGAESADALVEWAKKNGKTTIGLRDVEQFLEGVERVGVEVVDLSDKIFVSGTPRDFVDHFNDKYNRLSAMLERRPFQNPASSSALATKRGENVTVIGMVMDKRKTKGGHLLFELEDRLGTVTFMALSRHRELFKKAGEIQPDEVIAVSGRAPREGQRMMFIDDVWWPNCPLERKKPSAEGVVYLISDTHVGSQECIEPAIEKFLDHCEKEKEKIRAVVHVGDVCVVPGALIVTRRGFVPIEEVVVGDRVLTHTNRWRSVTKTYKRKVSESLVGIVTNSSRDPDLIATANHPVWATRRYHRYIVTRGEPLWTRADGLDKHYTVFNLRAQEPFHNMGAVSFEERCSPGDHIRSTILPGKTALDKDFLVVMGIFLGDGNARVTKKRGIVTFHLSYTKYDKIAAHYIRRWARKLNAKLCVTKPLSRMVNYYINSKPLAKFFAAFYDRGGRKHIPAKWLGLPQEQLQWILYGLILADGTVERRQKRPRVRVGNTSLALLKGILLRLEFDGMYPTLNVSRRSGSVKICGKPARQKTYYEIAFNNVTCNPILSLFGLRSETMQSRYKRSTFNYVAKVVRSVKRVPYSGDVYNLGVEGDNSYIANGIVVHNCEGVGVYKEQYKDLVIKDITKQYERAASYLSQIPESIPLVILSGNHDAAGSLNKMPRPRIPERFAGALYGIPNAQMVSNPAQVVVDGRVRLLLTHGESLHATLTLFGWSCTPERVADAMRVLLQRRHLCPTYGLRQSQIVPTVPDHLAIDPVPDALVTAHIHVSCRGEYRGVLLLNPGSTQGITPYMVGLAVTPTPPSFIRLDLGSMSAEVVPLGG